MKVRFTGDTKTNAILIPQRAVLQGPTGPFVFVVNREEKVEIREWWHRIGKGIIG